MDMLTHMGWGAALVAFGAGLVSFFSPCVAPLVPAYIGYLSGTSAPTSSSTPAIAVAVERRWLNPALVPCSLFISGFSLAFITLGLVSASFGGLIVAYRPVLETLAGMVMLAMGAFLLNLLPQSVTRLLMRERRIHLGNSRLPGGILRGAAPVLLGIVFAAGWTPCIGPVLAGIYAFVGASGDRGTGVLLLAFYSLGFALPFLAVGLSWSVGLRALTWFRKHGQIVTTITGVALIALGILYLAGEASLFATWAQQLPSFSLR